MRITAEARRSSARAVTVEEPRARELNKVLVLGLGRLNTRRASMRMRDLAGMAAVLAAASRRSLSPRMPSASIDAHITHDTWSRTLAAVSMGISLAQASHDQVLTTFVCAPRAERRRRLFTISAGAATWYATGGVPPAVFFMSESARRWPPQVGLMASSTCLIIGLTGNILSM